eukprot:359590-Chlamydomonas_euryale.AAC.18
MSARATGDVARRRRIVWERWVEAGCQVHGVGPGPCAWSQSQHGPCAWALKQSSDEQVLHTQAWRMAWYGMAWHGTAWKAWCSVAQRGAARCGVMWRAASWHGVVWRIAVHIGAAVPYAT